MESYNWQCQKCFSSVESQYEFCPNCGFSKYSNKFKTREHWRQYELKNNLHKYTKKELAAINEVKQTVASKCPNYEKKISNACRGRWAASELTQSH